MSINPSIHQYIETGLNNSAVQLAVCDRADFSTLQTLRQVCTTFDYSVKLTFIYRYLFNPETKWRFELNSEAYRFDPLLSFVAYLSPIIHFTKTPFFNHDVEVFPAIKVFNVSDVDFSDIKKINHQYFLFKLNIHFPELKKLSLIDCKMDGSKEGLKKLPSYLPNLTILELESVKRKDVRYGHDHIKGFNLSFLQKMPNLTKLNLYCTSYDDLNFLTRKNFKITHWNGEKYDGEFKEGKYEGKGTFTYPNGDIFEGDFVDNEPNGKGKFTYKDGSTYEGEFIEGNFARNW